MKILFGVPPKDHVRLTTEEVKGLTELNYDCQCTVYGKNDAKASPFRKLVTVITNAFALIKVLRGFKPEILYLSSRIEHKAAVRDFLSIFLIKLFYKNKIRIAIKSHGSDFCVYNSECILYRKIINPFLLKNVDAWLLLSTEEMDTMKKYNPSVAGKLFLTSNILTLCEPVSKDSVLGEFSLPKDKVRIFFSGRMIKAKGCYDIVDAVSLLSNPQDYIFVFLGDGEELENLKKLVTERSIDHLFLFLGYIPEDVSDQMIAHMDVLLFPSYDEGFSMVLFKSVAYGLPIITTRVRASKDYLKENENVLWVDTNAPEMIAEAIERLFEDKSLREKMSQNNIQLGKQFNRINTSIKLSEIFQTIK